MRVRQWGWAVVALAACIVVAALGCTSLASARPASARPRAASRSLGVAAKHAGFLTSVSCTAAGWCAAVGWYYRGSPAHGLAIAWNGRTWVTEPLASGSLAAVSCAATKACVAVGAGADLWTGRRWITIASPTQLGSISCPTSGYCQALSATGQQRPVAQRWDGSAWHTERIQQPHPRPDDLTIASLSCVSRSFCMAVGDYTRGVSAMPSPAYRDLTLAELWNGKTWRMLRTPDPSTNNQLASVSCVSASACTAVGASTGRKWTLAERWNGHRWTIQPTPNVSRIGYTALIAVSCGTRTACTAIGDYDDGLSGIAEHWNGTRWSLQRLPTPSGPTTLIPPAGISCTSATACVMVGSNDGNTLAERWDGKHWTIQPTPNPA